MWNGLFLPPTRKHRDYAHSSFPAHELSNGGRYDIQSDYPVFLDRNPINSSLIEPSAKYFAVDWVFHTNDWYRFLVPSEPDLSSPNWDRIELTMNDYISNPVEGGRDWLDYVDEDKTDSSSLASLLESEENVPSFRTRSIILPTT